VFDWALISAVMEQAANKEFDKLMMEYFKSLGLQHTYLEENDPLICPCRQNRSKIQ
jgi:hypothetical protein